MPNSPIHSAKRRRSPEPSRRSLARRVLPVLALVAASSSRPQTLAGQSALRLASPDARTHVVVELRNGRLTYAVARDGRKILLPSRLGSQLRGAPALDSGWTIADSARASVDTTWTQPWGEVALVRDHHNELRVHLAETAGPRRELTLVFRAFDDGIGFRYELPEQPNLGAFEIDEELTEFAMADNANAWWIAGNRKAMDRYEMLYSSSPVSMLDTVRTPLTMQLQGGAMVVLHEADLEDYAAMDPPR